MIRLALAALAAHVTLALAALASESSLAQETLPRGLGHDSNPVHWYEGGGAVAVKIASLWRPEPSRP